MESSVNENRNVITCLLPNSTSAEIRAHRPRISPRPIRRPPRLRHRVSREHRRAIAVGHCRGWSASGPWAINPRARFRYGLKIALQELKGECAG